MLGGEPLFQGFAAPYLSFLFTFNISIIKFGYLSFFHLVGKQSVERTQNNQAVKEIRNKAEPFIPTYEWQNIEEGKPIPPGIYVQMDLQIGKTEARLERNESKKVKAANGKTSLHRKWFRERKFRGNVISLQLFLRIYLNIWFEMRMSSLFNCLINN